MTIHLSEAELIDLLNGDVRPAAAELMLQHIDNCERCLTALREFEEFTLLVRKLPRYQIPESLAKQLNAFVDELVAQPTVSPSERTSWKECAWARRVIVPATLALLVGLGIWFHGHRRGFWSSEGELLPHATTLETQAGVARDQQRPHNRHQPETPEEDQAIASQGQPRTHELAASEHPPSTEAVKSMDIRATGRATHVPSEGDAVTGDGAILTRVAHPLGKVILAHGAPAVYSASDADGWILTQGVELEAGQSVHTGETDQLRLRLSDGAQVEQSFGTAIRFLRDSGDTLDAPTGLVLTEGEMWAWSPGDGRGVQIETAYATINVSKAEATIETERGPSDSATIVYALRGLVVVTAGPRRQVVPAGQTVVVTSDGQIKRRSPRSLAEIVRTGPGWKVKHHELWIAPTLSFDELLTQWAARRAALGVRVAPVAESDGGLRIYQVAASSPAALAGIQRGDVLLGLADHRPKSATEFVSWQLGQGGNGETDLRIRRHEEELIIPSALSLTEPDFPWASDVVDLMSAATRAVTNQKLDLAKGYLFEAAERNPECTAVSFNLGLLEEHAGRWSEALHEYRKAAQYVADPGILQLSCGRVLLGVGNLRGAIDELQQAIAMNPALIEARYLLGYAQLVRGNSEAARTQAEWLVLQEQTKGAGHCLLGQIAHLLGHFDDAVAHYEQALSHEPFHSGAALGLAQVRNAQGKLVEAERIARQIFEWGPSHAWMPSWRAAMLIAGIHFERKDYQGSEDWLQRALEVAPGEGAILANLGNVYRSRGNAAKSEHYYRQAVETDPEMVASHLGLAWILADLGDAEEAQEHYLAALELDPGNEQALTQLVALCRREGQQEEAVRLALHYDISN